MENVEITHVMQYFFQASKYLNFDYPCHK